MPKDRRGIHLVIKWFYRGIETPMGLVLVGALLALCLSSYPIIFFGKSYVSPGYGPQMLYEQLPYVPGYLSTDKENLSADAGAMPWQNLPYSRVQHEAVFEHGEFPLWNRYNSAGLPLFGQGQSQFLDPLHWIAVAGEGNSWAWDLKFLLSKLVFLVGIGACILLMTGNKVATIAVTISAAFIGFFYFRFNHPAYFNLTYAPWVFYGYLQLVRIIELDRSSWPHRWRALPVVVIFAASVLHLFAGTPKEGIVIFCVLHFAGLTGITVASRGSKALLSNVGSLLMLWVSIALATAPHWLIFLDTLSKVSTIYNTPNCNFANRPWQFVDTFFLGPKDLPWSEPNINTFIWVSGVAAFFAVSRWVKKPSFWMITFPLLGLLAFAYGVVPNSICQRIPFVGVIHHIHHTFFTSAVVFAVLLAGLGLASVLSDVVHNKNRAMWTTYSVIMGVLLAWWAYPHYDSYEYATSVAGMLSVLSVFGVTLIFLWGIWWPRSKWVSLKPTSLFLLAMFLLVHFYHGLHLNTGHKELDNLLINPTPGADFLQVSPTIEWFRSHQKYPDVLEVLLDNRPQVIAQTLRLARESGGQENHILQFEPDIRNAIHRSENSAIASAHIDNFLRGVGATPSLAQKFLVVDELTPKAKDLPRGPVRVIGEGRTLMPGFNSYLLLEGLNGPDALMSSRYMELLDALGWPRPPNEAWLRTLDSASINRLNPMLDILNVGYYVSYRRNLNVIHVASESIGYGGGNGDQTASSNFMKLFFTHHSDLIVDRVGCSSKAIEPDGEPDSVFSLEIEKTDQFQDVKFIKALRVERHNPIGVNHTGGHDYVLGVSHGLASSLLNNTNGEVRIPVDSDKLTLWLYSCLDGFDNSTSRFTARAAFHRQPEIERVFEADMNLWKRTTPWPRAYFVDSTAQYGDVKLLAKFVQQAGGRPLAAIQTEKTVWPDKRRRVVFADNYQLTTNTTSFTIDAPGPGIVVLTEVNIPGDVHVEIDGEQGEVLQVNHAFRGVKIEKPGVHRISFEYRPRLWRTSLLLSFFGVIILIGIVLVNLRQTSHVAQDS
jgi:hypothetical protein